MSLSQYIPDFLDYISDKRFLTKKAITCMNRILVVLLEQVSKKALVYLNATNKNHLTIQILNIVVEALFTCDLKRNVFLAIHDDENTEQHFGVTTIQSIVRRILPDNIYVSEELYNTLERMLSYVTMDILELANIHSMKRRSMYIIHNVDVGHAVYKDIGLKTMCHRLGVRYNPLPFSVPHTFKQDVHNVLNGRTISKKALKILYSL